MEYHTTIAAIATPHASGGIAVLRVSGKDALAIASKCFRPAGNRMIMEMDGYTCTYGVITEENGTELDDGILTVFRAPHSYTGEDVVEISCHGGIYITRRLLDALLRAGAAPAEAGEFTRRAYLAGKMTLTQAEAVMDLIGAAGERELQFAHAQQKGALFHRVKAIQDALVQSLGNLAAWADYPEDDIPAVTPEQLQSELSAIQTQLEQTLATYHYGKILHSGVSAVIVGKPNVGKSTLFNLLSGSPRSIVTDIAGTTRDIVEEEIQLGEITLRLSDTAGLRQTEDTIEKIGVELAQERLQEADLILAVFDGSTPFMAEDAAILQQLPEKPIIAIVNKSDKSLCMDIEQLSGRFSRVISMTAKSGEGLAELEEAIAGLFWNEQIAPEMGIVANARQKSCLMEALEQLTLAQTALKEGESLDAITVLLDEAADALLRLTGDRVSEAVVEDVFSRFCVGK